MVHIDMPHSTPLPITVTMSPLCTISDITTFTVYSLPVVLRSSSVLYDSFQDVISYFRKYKDVT